MTVGAAVDAAKKLLADITPVMAQEYPVEVAEIKEVAVFPFRYDEKGRCENLGEDNRCQVYDSRPDVCSVEKMHALYSSHIPLLKYYRDTAKICNRRIAEAGLDDKFRVVL